MVNLSHRNRKALQKNLFHPEYRPDIDGLRAIAVLSVVFFHAFPRGSNHGAEDQNYLHEVAEAIANAKSVLIAGPSNEKHELVKHIEHHDPSLMKIIAGVEALDHPTDKELLAHARKFFTAYDRMNVQK